MFSGSALTRNCRNRNKVESLSSPICPWPCSLAKMIPVCVTAAFGLRQYRLIGFQNCAVALLALFFSLASAVQPVKVQGADFINSVTNRRIQIIGVAYAVPFPYSIIGQSLMKPIDTSPVGLQDTNLNLAWTR